MKQVLDEYSGRISIDGGSKLLVSDADIVTALHTAKEPVCTPYGPTFTIASRGSGSEDSSKVEGIATFQPVDNLKMDFFTHASFGVSNENPKYILQDLKNMTYALQPRGIAIVTAIK